MPVPAARVRARNDKPVRAGGRYVLYWSIAARRPSWNFALDRALEHCRDLNVPLVVLEPLRVGYRWASVRHHAFVLQGMADNARAYEDAGVTYHPYVEDQAGNGKGLLEALAKDACVIVTDDYPVFFLPRMVAKAAARLDVRLEDVDSNGIVPMRAAGKDHLTAYAFRRALQAVLPTHLFAAPAAAPAFPSSRAVIGDAVLKRWPRGSDALLSCAPAALAALPIDQGVGKVGLHGGFVAGRARLQGFIKTQLPRYGEERSDPDKDAQSGLSPWLHFGHVSAHEVVRAVFEFSGFDPQKAFGIKNGSREGYWGLPAYAESFLDELITWREIGFNFAAHRDDIDQYSSLPQWARKSLEEHASDEREHVYTLEQFAAGATHDPVWNAAQKQLREEGIIHNYLRMLWGKKVLEWTAHPQQALDVLIELNNRYAVDGRDPNSYSGIFWTLGRYDRPWAPKRKVFGVIRFMSSQNTVKKLKMKEYLARYSAAPAKSARQASLL